MSDWKADSAGDSFHCGVFTQRGADCLGQDLESAAHNRADHPEPGKPPIQFPSIPIIAHNMSREDWGPRADRARPEPGHVAKPSWPGRTDLPKVTSIRDMNFGERVATIPRGWSAAPAWRKGND